MYEFLLNTLIFNDLLASQVLGKLRHLAPKLFFTQEWFLYFQKIELLAFFTVCTPFFYPQAAQFEF